MRELLDVVFLVQITFLLEIFLGAEIIISKLIYKGEPTETIILNIMIFFSYKKHTNEH